MKNNASKQERMNYNINELKKKGYAVSIMWSKAQNEETSFTAKMKHPTTFIINNVPIVVFSIEELNGVLEGVLYTLNYLIK